MRIALKTAISELKLPLDDPVGFRRYADRLRTYLFDPSRIKETAGEDIIDQITVYQKRISSPGIWRDVRHPQPFEAHPFNHFGEWLCDRADAEQTRH